MIIEGLPIGLTLIFALGAAILVLAAMLKFFINDIVNLPTHECITPMFFILIVTVGGFSIWPIIYVLIFVVLFLIGIIKFIKWLYKAKQ